MAVAKRRATEHRLPLNNGQRGVSYDNISQDSSASQPSRGQCCGENEKEGSLVRENVRRSGKGNESQRPFSNRDGAMGALWEKVCFVLFSPGNEGGWD